VTALKLPTAAMLLSLAVWPASTYAQADAGVATSFEQLQALVRTGNKVTVTDANGSQVAGRIDSLSSSALSGVVNGTRLDFSEMDVATIHQRRRDSIADGALRGLGAGAGFATMLMILTCGQCVWHEAPLAASVIGFSSAIGTGIGVASGARARHERTIDRRPGLNGSFRF
jgi:hypothetical protein